PGEQLEVIGVHLRDEERHERIHTVIARVADHEPSRAGERRLRLSGDGGVERGEHEGRRGVRLDPGDNEIVRERRPRRHDSPRDLGVAAAGRAIACRDPRQPEPRMLGEQRHEVLTDDARGAENADVDPFHHRYAPTATGAPAATPSRARATASSPSTRSATRSRGCSQPGESRTSVSDSPSFARSSGGIDACVIRAGWHTSAFTPPRLSPSAKKRREDTNETTSSTVPSSSNDTMPPNPVICRFAISWPGWAGSPGKYTRRTMRCDSRARAIASALSAWRCIRSSSVLSPRSVSQQSNGDGIAPVAFCRNFTGSK